MLARSTKVSLLSGSTVSAKESVRVSLEVSERLGWLLIASCHTRSHALATPAMHAVVGAQPCAVPCNGDAPWVHAAQLLFHRNRTRSHALAMRARLPPAGAIPLRLACAAPNLFVHNLAVSAMRLTAARGLMYREERLHCSLSSLRLHRECDTAS